MLKTIPFRESGLIVKAYTAHAGAMSFLVHGIRKNGKAQSGSYFMPMRELEVVYQKSNDSNDLCKIKEYRAINPLHRVYDHPAGISLLLFFSEVLYKSIIEFHAEPALYQFIREKMIRIEESPSWSGFPEGFLADYISHSGLAPSLNYDETSNCFNLKEARFFPFSTGISSSFAVKVHQCVFGIFSSMNREQYAASLPAELRKNLLALLLEYLYIHMMPEKSVRSHQILQEIL